MFDTTDLHKTVFTRYKRTGKKSSMLWGQTSFTFSGIIYDETVCSHVFGLSERENRVSSFLYDRNIILGFQNTSILSNRVSIYDGMRAKLVARTSQFFLKIHKENEKKNFFNKRPETRIMNLLQTFTIQKKQPKMEA